jgi:hypothetical protein
MNRAVYTIVDKIRNQTVDTIEFDLLDNPGCRAWQYAVMLNDNTRYFERTGIYIPVRSEQCLHEYEEFKTVLKQLDQTEFKFEKPVPEDFSLVNQNFMNHAHRYFTNSCLSLWNIKYANFENQKQINDLLQTLNELIHQLEPYLPTTNKLKYSWIGTNEIRVINNGQELGYDIFPFRRYHSYEPADLIMDPYILGKTLLESFMCEDDPTSWDTSGHVRTNGGSVILLDSHRQTIYNSQDFDQWLTQHGTNKHLRHADFSLGYFVPGHKEKLLSLKNSLHNFYCTVEIKIL